MLNEFEDFYADTSPVGYICKTRSGTTFLGRFVMDRLLDFCGTGRIFNILVRRYNASDLDHAQKALCAWCSMLESKSPTPWKEWENRNFVRTNTDAVRKGFPDTAEAI